MIELYCTLIINGKRDYKTVPVKYQEAVKQTLYTMGLDENGCVLDEVNE